MTDRVAALNRAAKKRGARRRVGPLSISAAIVLLVFLLLATFGPLLPLGNPELISAGPRIAPPSPEFPAGTDALGRDQLPRLIQGIRTTVLLSGVAVLAICALSVVFGVLAAYYKGAVGEIIMRAADVFFAFPPVLLAILVVAISGPGIFGSAISIVLICAPQMVRVIRATSLSVVHRDFITAARVGGAHGIRIMATHVVPNIAGPAVVQATYSLCVGMLLESGLSFLGLGVQPPGASLGSLVREGSVYLSVAPWLVFFPGILLAVAIVSVNLVGDGLRDLLDVRESEVRR